MKLDNKIIKEVKKFETLYTLNFTARDAQNKVDLGLSFWTNKEIEKVEIVFNKQYEKLVNIFLNVDPYEYSAYFGDYMISGLVEEVKFRLEY